jgi:hypothetical protein
VQRLGRAVIRAGISLPLILLYAFAPKPDSSATFVSLAALVLAVAGLRGLIQLKTWGVLALGAAGALTLSLVGADAVSHGLTPMMLRPAIASGLLFAAISPYLGSMVRFIAVPR